MDPQKPVTVQIPNRQPQQVSPSKNTPNRKFLFPIIFFLVLVILGCIEYLYWQKMHIQSPNPKQITQKQVIVTPQKLTGIDEGDILYGDGSKIALYDTKTTKTTILWPKAPTDYFKETFAFSPDGKYVFYNVSSGPSDRTDISYDNGDTYIYNIDSHTTAVASSSGQEAQFFFSSSQPYVLLNTNYDFEANKLVVMDYSGNVLETIPNAISEGWSPDGKSFIYLVGDVAPGPNSPQRGGGNIDNHSLYLATINHAHIRTKNIKKASDYVDFSFADWIDNNNIEYNEYTYSPDTHDPVPSGEGYTVTPGPAENRDFDYNLITNMETLIPTPTAQPNSASNVEDPSTGFSPDKKWKIHVTNLDNDLRSTSNSEILIESADGKMQYSLGKGSEAIWQPHSN